jgi:hypothetical protein
MEIIHTIAIIEVIANVQIRKITKTSNDCVELPDIRQGISNKRDGEGVSEGVRE